MKKWILLLIVLLLSCGMVACDEEGYGESSTSTEITTEEEPIEEFSPDRLANEVIHRYNKLDGVDPITEDDVVCSENGGGHQTDIKLDFATLEISYGDGNPNFTVKSKKKYSKKHRSKFFKDYRHAILATYPFLNNDDVDNIFETLKSGERPADEDYRLQVTTQESFYKSTRQYNFHYKEDHTDFFEDYTFWGWFYEDLYWDI